LGAAFLAGALVLSVTGVAYGFGRYGLNQPVTYASLEDHYKYGSIGGDVENGLPLEVIRVLPRAFPEYLPPGGAMDYTAFGFIQEPGRDMPIGFSVRQHLIPRTGLNCAPCHVGSWRVAEDEEPLVYLGMPAVNLDIGAYFQFLFRAAEDPRFTPDLLLPLMEEGGAELNASDRLLYARLIIPTMKERLLANRDRFAPLFADDHPAFGPGRVDTFNPYKVNQLAEHYPDGVPPEESIGTVAYPAIWNQGVRDGLALNWDGNSPTIHDRNVGAAFGAGATRESIDMESIDRVTEYLRDLEVPAYPWGLDGALLPRGEELYRQYCADCHDLGGSRIGEIEPLERIGTDPYRLGSYTEKLNRLLLDYGEGYPWKLLDMVKTDGYANQPLDGIWARAPYLHNGSVPTLMDLLTPEGERNGGQPTFWVGHGLYDTIAVGIRTDVQEVGGRPSFLFDTRVPGNGNRGHSGSYYGTDLPDADKKALIEYMKTIR
jgi:mono/diheme cytochrome c family protein